MPSDSQRRRRAAKRAKLHQRHLGNEHEADTMEQTAASTSGGASANRASITSGQCLYQMPPPGLNQKAEPGGSEEDERDRTYSMQACASAAWPQDAEQVVPPKNKKEESSAPMMFENDAEIRDELLSCQESWSHCPRPLSCPPAVGREHMTEQELAPPVFWRNGLVPNFHGCARTDVGFLRPNESTSTAPLFRLRGRERSSLPVDVGLHAGMAVSYSNTFLSLNLHMAGVDHAHPQPSIGSLKAILSAEPPRFCSYYHQNPKRDTCKRGYLCPFRHEDHLARPGAGERARRRHQHFDDDCVYTSTASVEFTSLNSSCSMNRSAGLLMAAAPVAYFSSWILRKVAGSPIAALAGSYHACQASLPPGHSARSEMRPWEEAAVSQARPEGRVRCPSNHAFQQLGRCFSKCHGCECSDKEIAYICRLCDFNLCNVCHSRADDRSRPIDIESWLPPKPRFEDADMQALSQVGPPPEAPVWAPPSRPAMPESFKLLCPPEAPMVPPLPQGVTFPEGLPHQQNTMGMQLHTMVQDMGTCSSYVPLALAILAILLLLILMLINTSTVLATYVLYFVVAFAQWSLDYTVQHHNKGAVRQNTEKANFLNDEYIRSFLTWNLKLCQLHKMQDQRYADWRQQVVQRHHQHRCKLRCWYEEVEQAAPVPFRLPCQPQVPMLPHSPQTVVFPEHLPHRPHALGLLLDAMSKDVPTLKASVPLMFATSSVLLSLMLSWLGVNAVLVTYGLYVLVAFAQWIVDVFAQHQHQAILQKKVDRVNFLNNEYQKSLQTMNLEMRRLRLVQEEQHRSWHHQVVQSYREHMCALQQWHNEVEQDPERQAALRQQYRQALKQWHLNVECARKVFQEQWCSYIIAAMEYDGIFRDLRLRAWARQIDLRQSWQRECRRQKEAHRAFIQCTFGDTLGRIIAFRRRAYMHYGIGDGKGSVVHFTNNGVICLARMADVADGIQRWNVVADGAYASHLPHMHRWSFFDDEEVLDRAMRRLQEEPYKTYSITRYNCEHFATEMRFGCCICVQGHRIARAAEEFERTFFGTNVTRSIGSTEFGQTMLDGIALLAGHITDGDRMFDNIVGLAGGVSAPTATFSQGPQAD